MTKPRERGAVTVEFALILPVFFIIVLAIVEFGIRYERNAELNNAAFIAARNMAITNDVGEATAAATAAGMPGSASISVGACANPGDDITVTITVTEDSPTQAFGSTFDVEGVGVARCEQ